MKEMHHNTNFFMPDSTALMLMAGSWSPLLAVMMDLGTIAMALSMAVSVLAGVDYSFKIYWKLSQNRKRRFNKRQAEEEEKQEQ